MSNLLEISTFGPLSIKLNGKAVRGLASRKAEALLVYLACVEGPHNRDVLATLLWDDRPQRRALGNLSVLLSSLRKELSPYLLIERHTVAFDVSASYWLDVAQIEGNVKTIAAQSSSSQPTSHISLRALSESVALYENDFLAGFYVKKASGFEEWVLIERERLRLEVIRLLDYLVGSTLANGDYSTGVDYAKQLLAIDPLREESHRQMMELLARSGERAAALAHYQECERLLAEELGVEPLPETRALYEQLRETKFNKKPNLPAQPTPFIGRREALATLYEHLSKPACRLLTLVGAGGMGKTRLAIAAASHAPTFLHGIHFVSLTSVSSAKMIVPAIANALDVAFYGRSSPKEQLIDFLRQKEMLILLDSCDHIVGDAIILADLLAKAPRLKLLTTSRERLNLQEEWLFEVGGLEQANEKNEQELAGNEAAQLFMQSAQRLCSHFVLSPDLTAAIARICTLVGGMPLAIELAASWVRLLSPAEIAAEIERSSDILTTSLCNVPQRHRSIRAVFEQSWQQLTAAEQDLFCKLSIFRAGFERQAAHEVAGASLLALLKLADKSFIRRTAQGRYEIHELLRQLAYEKLQRRGEIRHQLEASYARYYMRLLAQQEAQLKSKGRQAATNLLKRELDNILLAWEWTIEQCEEVELSQSLEALAIFYDQQGRYEEAVSRFEPIAACFTHKNEPKCRRLLALALAIQALFQSRLAAYEEAQKGLQQALTLLKDLESPNIVAFCYHQLGLMGYLQGAYEEGRQQLAQSVYLFEQTQNHWYLAYALKDLGNIIAEASFDFENAKTLYLRSLALAEASGDSVITAILQLNLGAIHHTQEEWAPAIEYYQKAITLSKTTENQRTLAITYANLGDVLHYTGEHEQSLYFLKESLNIKQNMGSRRSMIFSLSNLGKLMRETKKFAQAERYYQQALCLSIELELMPFALYMLTCYAALRHLEGKSAEALQLLSLAQEHLQTDFETQEIITKRSQEIISTLPAAVAQAAIEQGKRLDFEQVVRDLLADHGQG